ncbi:hypothetical protein Snoj_74430 [Streptomyces nojiriensis]|uniref:Uncharacterized protein n=1 Tax=Streptomyces nojiriensis TaxID=66374 RepID=A0ABQ3SZF4_9ACTN|nr:hypothetical protein GCM10010205_56830 [Streptomyces nojiriensis]GHI73525.1 hypothetical protein Snoj_74430 [Streptomyces nojiriensis]
MVAKQTGVAQAVDAEGEEGDADRQGDEREKPFASHDLSDAGGKVLVAAPMSDLDLTSDSGSSEVDPGQREQPTQKTGPLPQLRPFEYPFADRSSH